MGAPTVQNHARLGPCDKEGARTMKGVQPFEIQVGAVHDVEGAGLEGDVVKDIHVMSFSVGNLNKSGDGTTQIQQRVQLYRRLLLTEVRPRKNRKAEIDGGGIQRIYGSVQVDAQWFGRIHRARDGDQHLSKIGVDAPVARLVRVGQSRAGDVAPESQMI